MAKRILIEDVELGNSGEVSKDKINNNFDKVGGVLDTLDGEAVKKTDTTNVLGFSTQKVPTEYAISTVLKGYPKKEDVAIGMLNKGSVSSIANLPTNAIKGDAYLVESEGYIYQYDGTKWNKTAFTAFPSDVAINEDLQNIPPKWLVDADIIGNNTTTILSSSENADLEDFLYTTNGTKDYNSAHKSVTFKLDLRGVVSIDASLFIIGVYNGAFLNKDKVFIKPIKNTDGLGNLLVPDNAVYINLTVLPPDTVKLLYVNYNKYKQTNLDVSPKQVDGFKQLVEGNTVLLSKDNTTLNEGKIYNNYGILVDGGVHSTVEFQLDNILRLDISNYRIGVYGGAWLRQDKTSIQAFKTDGTQDLTNMIPPEKAYYIGITARTADPYKSIIAYKNSDSYTFENLVLTDKQIKSIPIGHWIGKKIVWLGTSVPYGSNTFNYESYASYAAKILGFNIVPACVPGLGIHAILENGVLKPLQYGSTCLSKAEYLANGTTIASSPLTPWMPGSENNATHPGTGYNNYYRTWENVFNAANADADLFVFDVAPNNYTSAMGTSDWDLFDYAKWEYSDGSSFADHRTTFLGALLFLMDKMYSINPNARMVFVLGSSFQYDKGKEAFNRLTEKWNIPTIDVWGKINTSPKSLLVINSKEGLDNHPSDFGHAMLGDMIANELLLIR